MLLVVRPLQPGEDSQDSRQWQAYPTDINGCRPEQADQEADYHQRDLKVFRAVVKARRIAAGRNCDNRPDSCADRKGAIP